MSNRLPRTLVDWLLQASDEPIDEKWVPGATVAERRALAALGGVADRLNRNKLTTLPTEVISWFESGPEPAADLVTDVQAAIDIDADATLAALYAELVAGSNRRDLGTFFTPSPEAALMLDMWSSTEAQPGTVIDIGAGVGVFTAAASTRWPGAHVVALDVNPVTLGLLAIHPGVSSRLLSQESRGPGIRLALDDFTKWVRDAPHGSEPRLFLGNPPYTRAQLLPREDRVRLQEEVNGLCGGRASLSTIISALCLLHLGPKDGLCLLLPAQWLESDYAQPLRQRLWSERRRRIEIRLVESSLFPDARVDAVALLVGSTRPEEQELVVGTFSGQLTSIERKETSSPTSWRTFFARANLSRSVELARKAAPKMPPRMLGDIARVRRGLATGANDFFLLAPDQLEDARIRPDHVRLVLRRLNQQEESLTASRLLRSTFDARKYVLMVSEADRRRDTDLSAYIEQGEDLDLHERELCRRREVWYDLEHDAFVPDVAITAMTRNLFHVVVNAAEAIITNNLYGWTWKEHVSAAERKNVVSWLRGSDGQHALRAVARRQGAGLFKIEPAALRHLVLPIEAFQPNSH